MFVVKLKLMNYGLGIMIFKEGVLLEDFMEVLWIVFKEDIVVLIEEFLFGIEYWFFVLDNDVKVIMLCVLVNVIGDGKYIVEELVVVKNSDLLWGINYCVLLELI